MSLDQIDEVFAVRRQVYRMVIGGIGEPFVSLAVQADPVQLELHVIVAAARHVVEQSGLFIDAYDRTHFELMVRERGQEFAGQVVEVEVLEAVAAPKSK